MGETEAAGRVSDLRQVRDPEIRRFLGESLGRITDRFSPEALLFFGSRVAGLPDEWSDIDLIIVSREFENMRILPRMALFRRVAQPHIRVDALCYTPEEFEYAVTQPTLVREAFRTGLRII